jgi:hypothetical protein
MAADRQRLTRLHAWQRSNRLSLEGLTGPVRAVSVASLVVAIVSGVILITVGLGWNPPGGSQVAAFGGEVPRFLIPYACIVMGVLAALATRASFVIGWRLPGTTRFVVGLAGAAVCALVVASGWVASGAVPTGGDRIVGWAGLAVGGVVALLPPARAGRVRGWLTTLSAIPFVLTLVVWATADSVSRVVLPEAVVPVRDVFAQGVITLVGSLAAAIGITILWSITLSAQQARRWAAWVGDHTEPLRRDLLVVGGLLGTKVIALVVGYAGWIHWDAAGFDTSRSDGASAWAIGAFFVCLAGWWLVQPLRPAPEPAATTTVVRWLGIGFTAVFAGSVLLGLASSVMGVWPGAGPASGLNRMIGWLLSSDPPVPLWAIVVTVCLALASIPMIRGAARRHLWATVVLAVWMAPRALELVYLIAGRTAPLDAPSIETVDVLVTGGLVVLAFQWWRGRLPWLAPRTLVLVLVASTLVADCSISSLCIRWCGRTCSTRRLSTPLPPSTGR